MVIDSRFPALAETVLQSQSITSKDLRVELFIEIFQNMSVPTSEHETIDKFTMEGERSPSEDDSKPQKDEYQLKRTVLRVTVFKDGSDTGKLWRAIFTVTCSSFRVVKDFEVKRV